MSEYRVLELQQLLFVRLQNPKRDTLFNTMNWLAHLLLSESSPAFRIGNILPDMLRDRVLDTLPLSFQGGIRRHKTIDSYTDSHIVVKRSITRMNAPFRRFGGVLTDVFYDHFLTRDWNRYSEVPLDNLVKEFYDSFDSFRGTIPTEAFGALERMREQNWLGSYGDLAGIETTLHRISFRLKRPFALQEGVVELERNYDLLSADFDEFFPQLVAHVSHKKMSKNEDTELRYTDKNG